MEKTCWEEFAKTGKVADYLRYRGVCKQAVPGSLPDKTNDVQENTKRKNR